MSNARKLVTGLSGGLFRLFYSVFEFNPVDDFWQAVGAVEL